MSTTRSAAPSPAHTPPVIEPAGYDLERLRSGGLRSLAEAVIAKNRLTLVQAGEVRRLVNQIPSGPLASYFDPASLNARAETLPLMRDQETALAAVAAAYSESVAILVNALD